MNDYPQLEIPDGWECIGYQTPKKGMGYITCNGPEFAITTCDFSECLTSVRLCFRKVEPVDHELEEAKKKFPDNSYFKYKASTAIYVVEKLYRDEYQNEPVIMIRPKDGHVHHDIRHCTPFPLPTWRCFDSDKPERSGYYYLRSKDRQYKKLAEYNPAHNWYGLGKATDYEWLDEGEL